ncbi:MAG: 3-deoxy-8-phosphooctulonate synthase, partial [Planctomycetota bacterium]
MASRKRIRTPVVRITKDISIGGGKPLVFFLGPCAIENRKDAVAAAKKLKRMTEKAGVRMVYKSSFDKANRSSINSYRGPGIEKGLDILREVKEKTGLPLISDIHENWQADKAAEVLDVLQIPAFLSRQTDLVKAAGETGKTINIKKGQWMAPEDMANIRDKIASTGNRKVLFCERGTAFGYRNLVVDMRGLPSMRAQGQPVVYDAGQSVQRPGGLGTSSG